MTARTKRALLGITNGAILSLIGLSITNWRFWLMALWTGIFAEIWSWIDKTRRAQTGKA